MSPLPTLAQAESLGLVKYRSVHLCPCGHEKREPGHLLGAHCRHILGLSDQPELFPSEVPLSCEVTFCEAMRSGRCTLSHRLWEHCVDRLEFGATPSEEAEGDE